MAITPPFFNKRESEHPTLRPAASAVPVNAQAAAHAAAQQAAQHAANAAAAAPLATPPKEGGSKLTVGPNIKLKGVEITDCDTLVVEGLVEATMDSRVMQISERGAFKGSAEIDIAEIHGQFDGNLTVRQKLMIFGTGRVNGKVRYGKVVIEEGGQLTGDIQFGATPAPRAAGAERAGLTLAV
jgi:cytoskeletal protein CcmA (bactofilin family)